MGSDHVALSNPEIRLGEDCHSEGPCDGEPLVIDRFHDAADRLGDPLLVEHEIAAGALDERGVEQSDRRVDDRVAVLQRGLENARGFLSVGVHLADDLQEPRRVAARAAAAHRPVSNRWKIRTLACSDAREAYGSVLVSPMTMLSS